MKDPNIQLDFFYLRGVASKNGPKVKKKNGSGNHKNDTKAEITPVCQQLRPKFFRDKLERMEWLSKIWF